MERNEVAKRFDEVFDILEKSGVITSRKEASALLGCSPQVLTETLSGRMKPTVHLLQNFFSSFGVNSEYVFLGKKPIFNANNVSATKSVDSLNTINQIPLVRIEALGGIGNHNFVIEQKDIQALYVVPDFTNIDFMIRVKGSSMYPKYNSGDVVACRILHEKSFIQWNKVHLIATKEQGILIKRLKKGSVKETLTAVSDNKDYDPFEIPWKEIEGIALVVGVIRLE